MQETIKSMHGQEEAFDIADQVIVFNRGKVEQSGTVEQLQSQPASPFVMQFISDTNSLPSTHPVLRSHPAAFLPRRL